ncbi:MAG: zinc-binding alcohol dehydrogenase [Streptosporangiaceae bacterium]|jgi:threonine dehydrogenase-like Zn-dependent dehydrogenase|nr:zinc-binding alcohol dehydrogenase [Streptosporangiaceae bacterium]
MTEMTGVRSLGVRAPGEPEIFTEPGGPLTAGGFEVETLFSGLSAGTELATVKGTSPFLSRRFDRRLRLFEDGAPTGSYPVRCLGYMEVGRVRESRCAAVPVGATVAMAYGHRAAYRADPRSDHVVALPGDLDPLLGVYVAQMGPICANGLLHAVAELGRTDAARGDGLGGGVAGRRVLVTGAGVVGLLTALFALHHGAAEVAVADPTPARLAAAGELGCVPVDERTYDPARWCKERWRRPEPGADVVFQCRGLGRALHTALRALRPQGSVIDLAFYQDGAADVRLGEEFHHNGLTVRCAQIGRVPRGSSWSRADLSAATVELLRARGADVLRHLVTDVVPVEEAPAFLRDLAARRRHTIQAVFTF